MEYLIKVYSLKLKSDAVSETETTQFSSAIQTAHAEQKEACFT